MGFAAWHSTELDMVKMDWLVLYELLNLRMDFQEEKVQVKAAGQPGKGPSTKGGKRTGRDLAEQIVELCNLWEGGGSRRQAVLGGILVSFFPRGGNAWQVSGVVRTELQSRPSGKQANNTGRSVASDKCAHKKKFRSTADA